MVKFDNEQFDNVAELQEATNEYLKGNYETAFNKFCELAGENNGRAMYFLGRFFGGISGVNVVKPVYEISSTWYKLGASRGDALAAWCAFCGTEDLTIEDFIDEYKDVIFEPVKTMAVEGDVFAQMEMFHAYYTGRWTEQNYDEAFKWCRKAAEAGNPDGMMYMGQCYESGFTGDKDDEEACRWYLKAVKLNNTYAMLSLGRQYNYGRVVQQNHDVAFTLYMRAAELGDHNAMYKLGNIYDASEPDFGVEKNSGEAIRWYQKAYDFGKGDFAKHKVEKLLKK